MSAFMDQLVNEVAKRCDRGMGTCKAIRVVAKNFRLSPDQKDCLKEAYAELRHQVMAK